MRDSERSGIIGVGLRALSESSFELNRKESSLGWLIRGYSKRTKSEFEGDGNLQLQHGKRKRKKTELHNAA